MKREILMLGGMMALAGTACASDVVLVDSDDLHERPVKRQPEARALPAPPQDRKEKSPSLQRMLKKKARV